jgi:hypothetical protein
MFSRSRKSGSHYRRRSDDGGERRGFDRSRLPDPRSYYEDIFGPLHPNMKGWASVKCPFHSDHHPSCAVNCEHGGYRCHACGASGGDILAFEMAYSGTDFRTAARDLGAWR